MNTTSPSLPDERVEEMLADNEGLGGQADAGASEVVSLLLEVKASRSSQDAAEPVACAEENHSHPAHRWEKFCLHCGVIRGTDLNVYDHPPQPQKATAGSEVVKALQWRVPTDHPSDPDPDGNALCADGLGGVYAISKKQKTGPERLLWWAHDAFDWSGFKSIDEAKAAAQADFASRIQSCIVTPSPVDASVGFEQTAEAVWGTIMAAVTQGLPEEPSQCLWCDKPCTCGGATCEQVDFGSDEEQSK